MHRKTLYVSFVAVTVALLGSGCDSSTDEALTPVPSATQSEAVAPDAFGEALPTVSPNDVSSPDSLVSDCHAAINDERLDQLQDWHGIDRDSAEKMANEFCSGHIYLNDK